MGNRRRRRRMRRLRIAALFVVLLGIAAAVLLGLFRMRTFDVSGNTRHSTQEIQSDLVYDFWTRNSLYFTWKYRNQGQEVRAPYLKTLQAKLEKPGAVRLIVQEKTIAGTIQYGGKWVYFDSEGMILEISPEKDEPVPLITGVEMEEPVLYQRLPLTNTALLQTMLKITALINDTALEPDDISFNDNLSITVTMGNVKVELGQDEYLEEKVANLAAVYPEIAGQKGTLNMTAFTGKSEPITFQEEEELTENYSDLMSDGAQPDGDGSSPEDAGDESGSGDDIVEDSADTGVAGFMVFDSSGTLRYDAHVVNGVVVDSYGNPIDGCTVQEDGNVKDAYWNVIDPKTGTLAQ